MDNRVQRRTTARARIGSKRVRTCLMCGKGFRSAGSHNRRCPRCNHRVATSREGSYYEPSVYSVDNTTDFSSSS
ncbi:MAG: hypothetical protein GY800_04020 [Planctomycetes bacterium]|nr:hypothetical protein [Planctomycetota bacterium]